MHASQDANQQGEHPGAALLPFSIAPKVTEPQVGPSDSCVASSQVYINTSVVKIDAENTLSIEIGQLSVIELSPLDKHSAFKVPT